MWTFYKKKIILSWNIGLVFNIVRSVVYGI